MSKEIGYDAMNGVLDYGLTNKPDPVQFAYGLSSETLFSLTFQIGKEKTVFDFVINPVEFSMDEPAATSIVPTLGSGKFVEKRGQIMKTITLQGTFGFLAPLYKKGAIGFDKQLDNNLQRSLEPGVAAAGVERSIPQLDPADVAKDSGFAMFHTLRDLIRRYWDYFRITGTKPNAVNGAFVVLYNYKDGEAYVVEPMNFRLFRARGVTYRYVLELRTLGAYKPSLRAGGGPTGSFSDLSDIYKSSEAFLSKEYIYLADAERATNAVVAARESVAALAKFPSPVPNLGLTGIQDDLSKYNYELLAKVSGQVRFVTQPLGGIGSLLATGENALRSWENVLSDAVTAASQAISVFSPIYNVIGTALFTRRIWNELVAKYKFRIDLIGEHSVEAFEFLWGISLRGGANVNPSAPQDSGFASSGSPLYYATTGAGSLPEVAGYEEATLLPGETGQQFAARTTGYAAAWPLIVVMNGLEPPYITDDPDSKPFGVAASGSNLLVPSWGSPEIRSTATDRTFPASRMKVVVESISGTTTKTLTFVGHPQWLTDRFKNYTLINDAGEQVLLTGNSLRSVTYTNTSLFTNPVAGDTLYMQPASRDFSNRRHSASVFGVDMKIVESAETKSTFDLQKSPSGDIAVSAGDDNMVQALNIKVRSRYGDLPMHTGPEGSFGLQVDTGSKATPTTAAKARDRVSYTFLSDERVLSVKDLKVSIQKDALFISVSVVTRRGTFAFNNAQKI